MWSKMIQRLLNEENLLIGISELSEIAEVSPRQLRYWEEKGYISSIAKDANGPRKYRLHTVVKVQWIKRFLDEGYTLQSAVEKAEEQHRNVGMTKKIFSQMFHGISEVCPNYVAIDLGDFDEEQKLYVVFNETTEVSEYLLIPKDADVSDELKKRK